MLTNLLSKTISLDGVWDFSLGNQANWTQIKVPGCWEAQGYSKRNEGPARYRRILHIPIEWAGENIFLEFEAVSYACLVKVNGKMMGEQRGLWTPFEFDITSAALPGQDNQIEVEIYKPGQRYPVRSSLAGFLPDVATSFGGIWQSVRLRALQVGIQDLRVDPDPDSGQVRIRGRAITFGPDLVGGRWEITITHQEQRVAEVSQAINTGCNLDVSLAVAEPALWSPASPVLYEVGVSVILAGQAVASSSQRFGFRKMQAREGVVVLNGQPVFLRGVLSWGWQPDKIAPAYTTEEARSEIRRVKALGFNLIKLCLFVPNQTYFDIADEEGIFLWEELPLWLPEVTPELRQRAPVEYTAITRQTCQHPAVVIYSLGCELSQEVDAGLLSELNQAVRLQVAGCLVCDNSGSGESYDGLSFDFADFTDYHPYFDLHYFEPLLDNWRRDWLPTRPWIFGEFSDSDGFRDLNELIAANGGHKPWWLTADNPVTTWRPEAQAMLEIEERLEKAKLTQSTTDLVQIAASQSLVSRKYTLEALRKRSGMGGYVITGLRDTPIATSGVFDDLDRPKWPAESLRSFNDDAVLCLDTSRRRRWINSGDRPDRMDPYNHPAGSQAHWSIILNSFETQFETGGVVNWRLSDAAGQVLQRGQVDFSRRVIPGRPTEVAAITCWLPSVNSACELRLEASLTGDGRQIQNAWPVWVYPLWVCPEGVEIYDPAGSLGEMTGLFKSAQRLETGGRWRASLVVAAAWCDSLEDYLRREGRVLLLQQGDGPLPCRRGPFWRENLKLFEAHPIWQVFPQRGFADLQFFGLASDVMLDTAQFYKKIPGLTGLRSILRRLDGREFYTTDYLVEAQVWQGRLLACSLCLQGGAGAQPSSPMHNPAGNFLLATLIHYLTQLDEIKFP